MQQTGFCGFLLEYEKFDSASPQVRAAPEGASIPLETGPRSSNPRSVSRDWARSFGLAVGFRVPPRLSIHHKCTDCRGVVRSPSRRSRLWASPTRYRSISSRYRSISNLSPAPRRGPTANQGPGFIRRISPSHILRARVDTLPGCHPVLPKQPGWVFFRASPLPRGDNHPGTWAALGLPS